MTINCIKGRNKINKAIQTHLLIYATFNVKRIVKFKKMQITIHNLIYQLLLKSCSNIKKIHHYFLMRLESRAWKERFY